MNRRAAVAAAGALLCAAIAPAAAIARDEIVTSFDGTRIVAHFYGAERVSADGRAPTMLVGPGYGKPGDTSPLLDVSEALGTATLRREGYNVLTWDPRGLGSSGGVVMFNSPAFEGRDVQALVDYVARQPEALLDAPGDPRVGMSGYSYGAGIQLPSAAIDERIDALVPHGGWNSLLTSFFKDGAVKAGWFAEICAGGEAFALTGGLLPGAGGLEIGSTAAELKLACVEAIATGSISAASRRWFAAHGPHGMLDRVRAPTLLIQGTSDSLFPPSEAIANYAGLRAAGTPVKMLWYCGGHGPCLTAAREPSRATPAALAWLARWLKRDPTVDTGAPFEWIADDGIWRAAGYPLERTGSLQAAGSALLTVTPVDTATSGIVLSATPAVNAANIRFPSPPAGSDIVGEPTLRLSYRGTAVPSRTFLYAHVIDAVNQRVVGVQVTPIPVILDGRRRTVERPLEPIAVHGGPHTDLRLQVTPGTNVYAPQRSVGTVRLGQIEGSLPLVDVGRVARSSEPAIVSRRPRRPRITVSSSRRRDGVARVVLRARLGSRPCSGTVRFALRARGLVVRRRATVGRSCVARTVVSLRVRRRTVARVLARFEGNATLAARQALSVRVRLR